MAEIIVAQRMWQRRDTAANWTAKNPVLAAGEWGIELGATTADPQKAKAGNGVTDWATLAYFGGSGTGGVPWLVGAGAPGGGLGVDGDIYLNTTNGDVYQRVTGAWGSPVVNVKGPVGPTGAAGPPGTTSFAGLTDAPASYAGSGGHVVHVKASEDGLEFLPGAGGGSVGLHMVPVMAGYILPSVTGGATAVAATASAASQPDIVTVNFNQTTQQFAQFAIPMPKSWDHTTTITALFNWSHPATTVNFGVEWGIQCVAVSDNDAINQAFGTAVVIADTGGVTNRYYRTSITSAMTPGGSPAQGDTLFFRISRNPASGSDTMAVAARLHSVELYITTNAATDA